MLKPHSLPPLFWYLGWVAGLLLLLGGLWGWFQPSWAISRSALLVFLGGSILLLLTRLDQHPAPLTPEQLQEQGIGHIAARIAPQQEALRCQHCRKSFHTPPKIQGTAIFCSDECMIAGHTRMEKPRFYLQPPLTPEQCHTHLEQAIQLGERALQASSKRKEDRPLLLATHQGKGALSKSKRVIQSLRIYKRPEWADQLAASPPPEPQIQGGLRGSKAFFKAAKKIQAQLDKLDPHDQPFALFQLTEPIDLTDAHALAAPTPQHQEAKDHLLMLLEQGQREFEQLLQMPMS